MAAYENFARRCPRSNNAAEARRRASAIATCDGLWTDAWRLENIDRLAGFIIQCPDHREVTAARNRIANIRATPWRVPGLYAFDIVIPTGGLATHELQTAAAGCNGGNISACQRLGVALDTPSATQTTMLWAATLHARACAGGELSGCGSLGYVLYSGRGVTRDLARAFVLAERACSGGVLFACNNLGAAFNTGAGTQRDYQAAIVLFERACNNGNAGGFALGCRNAGETYENGMGQVLRDRVRALQLAEMGLRLEPTNAELIALRNRLRQ